MSLKDILVLIDPTEASTTRLNLAADLAARHGARLIAACQSDAMLPALAGAAGGLYGGGVVAAEIWNAAAEGAKAGAEGLEEAFWACLQRQGVHGEFHLLNGIDNETVVQLARSTDVSILSQVNPRAPRPGAGDLIESLMLRSGRPVLMVPFIGARPTLGQTVLIGWNYSRESVRAVNDALPVLQRAQSVTLLAVSQNDDDPDEVAGADIAAHLARHGVPVTASRSIAAGLAVADVLLDYAADIDADMLIAGGYGDSPFRERLMGGVTRNLLKHMTLPMWLSH